MTIVLKLGYVPATESGSGHRIWVQIAEASDGKIQNFEIRSRKQQNNKKVIFIFLFFCNCSIVCIGSSFPRFGGFLVPHAEIFSARDPGEDARY